jgi:hypothetical protein
MNTNNKTHEAFWDAPLNDLLKQLDATPEGLAPAEARERLRRNGPNCDIAKLMDSTLDEVNSALSGQTTS